MNLPTPRERWNKLNGEFDLGLINHDEQVLRFDKFMDFTGTAPQLSDYVPCKDGEPMESPRLKKHKHSNNQECVACFTYDKEEYQKALDACKFVGWRIEGEYLLSENSDIFIPAMLGKTIEQLITSGIALEPVDSLIKELKL